MEEGVAEMTEDNPEKIHELLESQKGQKEIPPSKDIYSSKRHGMNYVTVDGVKLRTGYDHKKDWYMLCLKELLDNAVDFLWSRYQGASNAAIIVYIEMTNNSRLLVKVKNTNPNNIEAFTLDILKNPIFDFDMTAGSKQNLHIISRGVLGDAMKQVLTLPYVLIHTHDDGTEFTNRQWPIPLIIRSNGKVFHIPLYVDLAGQKILPDPKETPDAKVSSTDTEIEVTLPIIEEVKDELDIHTIEQFCKEYPIFTTDISFEFTLIDNSPDNISESEPNRNRSSSSSASNHVIADAITIPARKAAIEIKYPALHSITEKWNNKGSIHSYKPGEFITFIESVHNKANTTVYERIQQLREGTNIKMDDDNRISIAELVADPNKAERVEELFNQLRKVWSAPDKLSLPYTINSNQRKQALVNRISLLHKGRLDTKKASYRSFDDVYKNRHVSYPYVFEIIAIPYNELSIENATGWLKSEFKGSVNYSISPHGNAFEGEYKWEDPKKSNEFYRPSATSAFGILSVYNFYTYMHMENKAKLPCVIFANLVTPNPVYHGADKSRIDTEPYTKTIIKACRKIAEDIQTFKAAGWNFTKHSGSSHTPVRERKKSIEDIIELTLKMLRDGD